jgi:hypothetical protein
MIIENNKNGLNYSEKSDRNGDSYLRIVFDSFADYSNFSNKLNGSVVVVDFGEIRLLTE